MKKPVVYVVSDSVGETAELMAKAAISQFNGSEITIKRVAYVDEYSHLDEVIERAKDDENAIIAYTLVRPEMQKYIAKECEKFGIVACDLIGPLINKVAAISGKEPLNEPGLVRKLDGKYYKKVSAIEFAVRYDDGRDPKGILDADIVLIGVSRTSKTPLSQYLAHKSFKVTNVPLVPEVDPPEELFMVPPEKIFGLEIDADSLNQIRRERLVSLGLNDKAVYATIDRIDQELDYFNQIVNQLGCKTINITNKAVEETANMIISSL